MARFTTNFESEALKRPITIEAVLPADHMVLRTQPLPKKNMPYKTLYLLEGVTGNASGIFNYSKLMGLAEDYNLAVVCIGGENKWWSSMTAMNENFGDMVTRDVVNFTRRVFCLSDRREDTFIGGFSMGGYGAFVNGFRHPELFSRIIAVNSALQKVPIMTSVNEPTWDMFLRDNYEAMFNFQDVAEYENSDNDYEFLAETVAKTEMGNLPKIFMACGKQDGLYDGNTAYRDLLKNLGYEVDWLEFEGNHSWYSFDIGMEGAVKWLPLENFRENIFYYGKDAHIDGTNFAHWSTIDRKSVV